ncbi:MAG: DMT family transporter [Pseudomonadota bacterium]
MADQHKLGAGQADRLIAIAALVTAPLLWSSSTILVRALHETLPVIGFSFWRWLFASLLLLPFAWPHLRREWPAVRANIVTLALAGFFGITLFAVVLFNGLKHTTAVNTGVISASEPLWIALVAWILLRERLRRLQWAGIAIGAVGMIVIASQGSVTGLARLQLNQGDLLVMAAVIIWALYSVLIHKLAGLLRPVTILMVTASLGTVFHLPFYGWELASGEVLTFNLETVLAIGYGTLFSSLIAFGAWTLGVGRAGANTAGIFLYLIPPYTIGMAALILGEPLELYHVAGGVIIVAGIVVATRRRRVDRPRPAD